MKKLLLFAVVACTMGMQAHAQTAQETVDWLNVKLKSAMALRHAAAATDIETSGIEYSELELYANGQFTGLGDDIAVPFAMLTDVSSRPGIVQFPNQPSESSINIVFTGFVVYCSDKSNCTQSTHPPTISISLLASTPTETVNSIVKALKHIAQLNGAKLVNDDLFK